MGGEDDAHLLGGTAIKPKGWDRKGLEAFKYMLYNPDTGEVLTRTPLSWLLIISFYIVYYAFLAGFWIASLQVFFLTLPTEDMGPRWTLDYSLIGMNPGVGIRPSPSDKRIDSHLFLVNTTTAYDETPTNEKGDGDKNADYALRMGNFLQGYDNTVLSSLGECEHFPYGYLSTKEEPFVAPCIYLKLNKIWGWEPQPIAPAELGDPAYDDMSQELKTIITEAEDPNHIWVDCQGYKAADREKFDVSYYPPNRGIPAKYFPYLGGQYQAPMVAVKFNRENPEETVGQLIHVECRAWYRGVKHSTRDKEGLVRYEILFDNSIKPTIGSEVEVAPFVSEVQEENEADEGNEATEENAAPADTSAPVEADEPSPDTTETTAAETAAEEAGETTNDEA